MYTLKVSLTSGITELQQVTFEGVALENFYESGSIRLRKRLTGDITFFGDAYKSLLNEKIAEVLRLKVYLYLDSGEIYSGMLQLQGEWRLNENVCILPVEIDDNYTLLLQGIDTKFSFNPVQVNSHSIVQVSSRDQMQGGVNIMNIYHDDPETEFSGSVSPHPNEYDPAYLYRKARDIGKGVADNQYYSGYRNQSFCKVGTQFIYAALNDGPLVHPDEPDQNDWVRIRGSDDYNGFPLMKQLKSEIRFNGAILSDYQNQWVKPSLEPSGDVTWDMVTISLWDMLESSLQGIDPSITMGSWDFGELYVYSNNGESFDLTLSDIIGIYKTLFNVDWMLDQKVFEFKTVTQVIPEQPLGYAQQPYQYVDRVLGKDWSSQVFQYDLKDKIRRFSLEIDKDSFYLDFIKTNISFDTFYTEAMDMVASTFVLDIAKLTTSKSDKIAVILQDGTGFMFNDYGLEDFYTYNIGLSLYEIVKNYYKYDQPFSKGELWQVHPVYGEPIDLIKAYNETVTIDIPMDDPDLIDFGYYLKSSFGDLKVLQVSTLLDNQKTVINAARQ